MSQHPFVHLHLHSYYSLLDGLQPPEAYVKKAKEQGCPAIALTDHGVMHGGVEFYKACKKAGIKPILGCEVYIAFNSLKDKRHQIDNKRTHCVLLAENNEGYENLLKMITVAHLEGYYYKPRIDWELLKKHSKGIIALSGCLQGDLAQAVMNEDDSKIKEVIERFQSTLGKDNFFLELQDHPLPQQAILNNKILQLHKELGVPVVATADCHYVNKDDNVAQDIMLCIQTGKNLDEPGRLSMMNADYSMRPPEEIYKSFAPIPEAIENTLKIAERCNVTMQFDKPLIPTFPVPEGMTEAGYLRELCYQGLIRNYKLEKKGVKSEADAAASEDPEVKKLVERLNYELGVIENMGFVGYFLIVWDFVKWAKDHGIVVGPGRGSAAGAIVSYTLDITELDPLKYTLLFERFLNPERISMPDIDLDFADDRRDEVLEYVSQKYGKDRVAQICTFGTLAARAAVKDVGRVLGVPFVEMNEFAKLIPEKPGTTLEEGLEQSKELREAVDTKPVFKQIMDSALRLEGAVRHVSVHACGVVIAPEPLTKYTALQYPPKEEGKIITQYEAKSLEALGLLKMDFLGLKNLTILQTALKIIERTKGKNIVLRTISMTDKKTFSLMARGETTGVFQLESAGMKRYLKDLKPTEFEDIIAMVALYRPGPMEWIPDYIQGKHDKKKVHYLHPDLEPILRNTYGIAIYQEQILQIAQAFAGYSLGEADLLRRAIGKKIIEELMAQKQKFIEGAIKKGYKADLATMIFEKVVEPFAGYGFNKSHAACYAMIAYQTAYLKAHYPTEFMTALMSCEGGDTDRIVIEIGEANEMGIEVLPPDINESRNRFTVVKDGLIRFGLAAIKGLGEASIQQIMEERDARGPFKSIEDLAGRLPSKIFNKKTLEALSFGGALDSLGERNQIVMNHDKIADFAKGADASELQGQDNLFSALGGDHEIHHLDLDKVEPATPAQKLKWEKEFLGLYVSAHPLAGLSPWFKKKCVPLGDLMSKAVNKPIKVGGMITSIRKIVTKKGATMAIVFLEDPTGKAEAVAFPDTYSKIFNHLVDDQILFVEGTLEERMGSRQVVIKEAQGVSLEVLQAQAKKEKLWAEGEKIASVTRKDLAEEEVAEAEEVLNVKPETIKEVGAPDTIFTPQDTLKREVHQVMINREVTKDFFVELKKLLEAHPGKDRLELLIGDKVVPVPMAVAFSPELEAAIEALIKA